MLRFYTTLLTCILISAPAIAASLDQEASCTAAWDAIKNRDYPKAIKATDPKKCPLTRSYATWRKLKSDRFQSSFSEYTHFLASHDHWPWVAVLKTKAEKAINDKTPDGEVLNWYEKRTPHTAAGALRYLKALSGAAQKEKFQKVVKKAWHTLDFSAGEQKVLLSKYGSSLSQKDHRIRMEYLLNEQKLDQAKRTLPLLSQQHRAWANARMAFIEDHPDPHSHLTGVTQTHDLIFEQIRWHRKKDNLEGASLLKSVPAEHTENSAWWKERAFFSREALNQGNPKLAYELMSSHPYKEGAEFADAEFFCGFISLQYLKKHDQAATHFKRFAQKSTLPRSKSKASFWLARAYEASGNKEAAEAAYREAAKYPTTFYGMVAKRRFQKNVKLSYLNAPNFKPEQWKKFEEKEFVRMAYLLKRVNMGVEAEPFLYLLAKSSSKATGQEKLMALKVIQEVHSPYVVFASKDMRYQEIDLFPWLYPRRSIDSKVRQTGVDPHLLHAVMRQESGFNTRITSPAGAMGLMQLMPKTASVVAKKKGVRHQDSMLHSDPDHNMFLGAHYLKEMLDTFQGSELLAVAAYNAGPGPVQKWIERYGDPRTPQKDALVFIEEIPYSETRAYVQSVLANRDVYVALQESPKEKR